MKSRVVFGNSRLKKSLDKLKKSNTEDKKVYHWIVRALNDLEQDAFSGIQIPKNLIPRYYKNRSGNMDNLWKYNLPNAWRLIYTIKKDRVSVLSIVLEWMTHKEYERRFKY